MTPSGLLAAIGVNYIDHLAVTTPHFVETLQDYLALPGSRLLRGPGSNPTQRVKYAFVQLAGGWTVEILAPEADSPVATHIQAGGGAYHFCYAVNSLDEAVSAARDRGAKVLVEPVEDVAFDGRRVAFVFHAAHGLLELVEAMPKLKHGMDNRASKPATVQTESAPGDMTESRLNGLMMRLFPALSETEIKSAAANHTPGWDSLRHLRLIMELEAEFGISIPADKLAALTSFDSIRAYLRNHA